MIEGYMTRFGDMTEVENMNKWDVFKILERSIFSHGCYISTFRSAEIMKLQYKIGFITIEREGGRGLSCIQVPVTTMKLLTTLHKNTDRLVLARCDGWFPGEPPLEYSPNSGKVSVLVWAIKPRKIICTYKDLIDGTYTYNDIMEL